MCVAIMAAGYVLQEEQKKQEANVAAEQAAAVEGVVAAA